MLNRGLSSSLKRFRMGETIFSEGDPGDWAYIIESGRVEVAVNVNGQSQLLGILSKGDVLGEMAVMDTAPRSASATALEETVCVTIPPSQISDRVAEADPVIKLLVGTLLNRMRNTMPALAPQLRMPLTLCQSLSKRALDKMRLESELRAALNNNQLRPYYQPQVNIQTGEVLGFEALTRWFSSTRGYVSPQEFTSLAEETSLIIPIGQQTIQQACRDLVQFQQACPQRQLSMSINVAPRQLAEDTFLTELQAVTKRNGLHASQIKLEVTEGVFMADPTALEMLQSCRQAGFHVSLDDFGTGFSSLSYLTRFEVDGLKIDRAFVQELLTNRRTQILLKSILAMAQGLGIETVVEGIETQAQLMVLQRSGCDIGQGYLFGRPFPFEAARQLLTNDQIYSLIKS